MKFFYLHPFKPQYYFPEGFEKHDVFLHFFTPFSFKGKFSWYMFKKYNIYRNLFSLNNIEHVIAEKSIRNIAGKEALIAYNSGTIGPEQKITAIGINENEEFFIKYGTTSVAKKNINNEQYILKQLSHLDFVPKLLDFYYDESQTLLKTSVLQGVRVSETELDKIITKKLVFLSKQKIKCYQKSNTNLKTAFAHGDFTPWNLMYLNNRILIYDWEMAGEYTLGYDLFTYIFQTKFVLNDKSSIKNTLNKNSEMIEYYFLSFNVKNWKCYLKAFANEKLMSTKYDKSMLLKFKKLFDYATKN